MIKFRASVILVIYELVKGANIIWGRASGAALILVNRFDFRPQFFSCELFLRISDLSQQFVKKGNLIFQLKF